MAGIVVMLMPNKAGRTGYYSGMIFVLVSYFRHTAINGSAISLSKL
jgi:hypothetical protein